jgi:superfamily II DNA/RNA helicase
MMPLHLSSITHRMPDSAPAPSRDDLAAMYLDTLPYAPYPVQEEALLAWFTNPQGVLVCAPTGTGKTLIAEAALFEALHSGRTAYYTTPLIALTEQKFREMQEAAVRWGFSVDDVGLVTGNRAVNPRARVLVVVAEILLNRLLHPGAFDFSDVAAVVMDEFHSFADVERGIVWELSLAMLPKHVRLLLLSATVGNAPEFVVWLSKSHGRSVQLVQSTDRKVPLTFHWVGDQLLNEQIELMADGDESRRRTPALIFCFNRDQCWDVADQLKGKHLVSPDRQKELVAKLERYDWSGGAGPRLKQILTRGVGVHHAGVLPKYKRVIEDLFQQKLLSVVVCTETLAAGMNLPARSVVLTTLLKGPPGKKKLIDASSAHQMFGRAGRPQYDTEGHVYALAHEDDVKIARWKQKHDLEALETSPDPNLRAAAKRLRKKMPTRRTNEQYWNEDQFAKLIEAPPGKLASRGQLPWRLLAYLLSLSPEVERVRAVIRKRLLPSDKVEASVKQLTRMLTTLWAGGFVTLEPTPPLAKEKGETHEDAEPGDEPQPGTFGALLQEATARSVAPAANSEARRPSPAASPAEPLHYEPRLAVPTEKLQELFAFRAINPLFGSFLLRHLGRADREEWLQVFESVLEVPGSMVRMLRVPPPDVLPPGPLAREFLDEELVTRGLIPAGDLYPNREDEQVREEKKFAPTIAEKLTLLFRHEFPHVTDLPIRAVRSANDLVHFGGDFNAYVTGRGLAKQEGILFRHFLRLILLCGEFREVTPDGREANEWQAELRDVERLLTDACRGVDPHSTDYVLEHAHEGDVVEADAPPQEICADQLDEEFGAGLFDS